MTRFAVVLMALGCATASEVETLTLDIDSRLQPIRDTAKACAPAALAMVETRVEFARYESERGRGLAAQKHLATATAALAQVMEQATGAGCEGDRDGDGIADALDRCPDIPEDFDNEKDDDGCPDVDRDGDKVSDDRDKCPAQAEDHDGFEDQDGCPEFDNDKDGLPDDFDQCKNEPEDYDKVQDQDGCPDLDNDGDDVPDAQDRCPSKPGPKSTQGCPDDYNLIVFGESQIELRQPIVYQRATGNLLPQSNAVLDEIAQLLKRNPKVRIRIEGHTDSDGPDGDNLALSKKVAENTRRALTSRGIAGARLVVEGKGEGSPIDENESEEGRAANRRVELHLVK